MSMAFCRLSSVRSEFATPRETTLFGSRRKGTEREEADRKAYFLLSRYWRYRKSPGSSMEARIQYNGLMKRYLEKGRVPELFQIWKEDHNMVYKDAEEEKKRLEAFETTLKRVVKRNPECGYSLGLNNFAAKFPEEIEMMYNRCPSNVLNFEGITPEPIGLNFEGCTPEPIGLNFEGCTPEPIGFKLEARPKTTEEQDQGETTETSSKNPHLRDAASTNSLNK